MGVFGAVFGRRGDAGFKASLLGVSSGVVGFNVAMLLCLVREKFALRGLMVGVSAKKFALHAQNTQNSAFLRLLGEFFRANWYCAGLGCSVVHFRLAAGGVCSIRNWLVACRRRVRASCRAIPPWGDAGQILEPGCMLCAE